MCLVNFVIFICPGHFSGRSVLWTGICDECYTKNGKCLLLFKHNLILFIIIWCLNKEEQLSYWNNKLRDVTTLAGFVCVHFDSFVVKILLHLHVIAELRHIADSFAALVIEIRDVRNLNSAINWRSFFCCWQLELKGKISDKQMDDLITSYTAMYGPPQFDPLQLGM